MSNNILKKEIEELKEQNKLLQLTLTKSKEINKSLLLILFQEGIIKKNYPNFSVFKDAMFFNKNRANT